MIQHNHPEDVFDYDRYVVTFSGGKDSMATFLHLLDIGIPKEKIELMHHDIDGQGALFMDWECTPDYCKKFAAAFDVAIYFSWKHGGFLREMLRKDQLTAPIYFETPDGLKVVGGDRGKLNTRRKFPQVTADLKTRWCSAYLKIDVGSTAIRNQPRFNNSRTLVISGERGQESPARAKYAILEPDRSDNRKGKSKRYTDRWRPIRDWTEQEVWEIIERYKIRVHPAYYMGWGRVSCKFCIFGNANQFASAFYVSPLEGQWIVNLEEDFGYTIKRNKTLLELVAEGTVYPNIIPALKNMATSYTYDMPIFTDRWLLPAGAYGESCGPT
jgi:3'-phosphoadenosine 5'-phosphosulfate sulfotransferase (PAPS reductase)/FAD synthetase